MSQKPDPSMNDAQATAALPACLGAPEAIHSPGGPQATQRARFKSSAAKKNSSGHDPEIDAQILGGGEKRGLKGGPETLSRAKSTYLQSEFSGPNDRRPSPGRITKTTI